jgi:hypothetical protein
VPDVPFISGQVAIFTCPVDALQTETKGTVLIKTAEELTNFTRGEETQLEDMIKVSGSLTPNNTKSSALLPVVVGISVRFSY